MHVLDEGLQDHVVDECSSFYDAFDRSGNYVGAKDMLAGITVHKCIFSELVQNIAYVGSGTMIMSVSKVEVNWISDAVCSEQPITQFPKPI